MDKLQVQVDALYKKYFPPETGHRCLDSELEQILQMLSRLGRSKEFCGSQDKPDDPKIKIRLSNENKHLLRDSAAQVIKLLNGLKAVDLKTITAQNLEVHLKNFTGTGPAESKSEERSSVGFTPNALGNRRQALRPPPLFKTRNIPIPIRRGGGGRIVHRPPVRKTNRQTIIEEMEGEVNPRKWNGPGMQMLPVLYGDALHRHTKYASEHENWTQENAVPVPLKAESPTSSLSKKNSVVPVYQEQDVVQIVCEDRERLQRVATQYLLQELATRNGVTCYRFVRSTGQNTKIVIVVLNLSWYLWRDNLEQHTIDRKAFHDCNLGPWLKDPTGSCIVKSALNEMSGKEKTVNDLFLTSLRNFDKIREIDDELGQVLEVLFFIWKNRNLTIQLL